MYLPRASAPWLPVQPAERLTRYTTNLQRQPRQQIHAAGMIGPPFSKKGILRPAGGGIPTESNNRVFAPRTEETTTDEIRKRIERWMDRRFAPEREISDNTVTRAYDVFVGMSDEQLAQVRADVEGVIASMPPVQDCPEGQQWGVNGECVVQAAPPQPQCTERQHLEGGRCICDAGTEMFNGECVQQCPSGQDRGTDGRCACARANETMDSNGLCACRSPNSMVNGVCTPAGGSGGQTGGTCPTDQHWDRGTGRCLCDAPNEMNAVGACVPPGTPQACPEGLVRNAANECVPGPAAPPVFQPITTPEALAQVKKENLIKGAVAGASAVGLGVLIYKLLF